jgi:hypothetical protein
MLAKRLLIGSDLVIVLAIVMHLYDAAILACTRVADGTIAFAALLTVFRLPWITSLTVFACALAAAFGHWCPNLSPQQRMTALIGQQTILIIPALGAIYAIFHGAYADGVQRPWEFISADQFVTIGAAIIYTAAISARVRS